MPYRAASTLPRFTLPPSLGDDHSTEIDIELLTFIERYATTHARWDLLAFFGRNPSARESASEIGQRIGRGRQVIQQDLDDLAYLGVLSAHRNGNGMLYELAPLPETRSIVERFSRHLSPDGLPVGRVKRRE